MPLTLSFEEPSLFVEQATGIVTYEEALRIRQEMMADPRLRKGTTWLIVSQGVTRTPSGPDLAFIAQQTGQIFARGLRKLALVSDTQSFHDASNLFADYAYLHGATVKVFREEQEARRWLKDAA